MAGIESEWERSIRRPEDVLVRTNVQLQNERMQQVDPERRFTPLNLVNDFDLDAMLRHARIIPTNQSIHFLSKDNLEAIHRQLIEYVIRHTNHRIVRQNSRDVFAAMISIYKRFEPEDMSCIPMEQQIEILNRETTRRIGKIAIRNMYAYLGYIRDKSGRRKILDRGVRDSGVRPGYLRPKMSNEYRDPLFGNVSAETFH